MKSLNCQRGWGILAEHPVMLDTWWEPPEKLKSCDDDQAERLRCGGNWRSMSMQRNGEYWMHKVHRSDKYMVQRRDGVAVAAGFAVDVVVEGDSCMKKD
jgi:hypothetical protein